jgi:hypothetical protein
MSVPSNGGLRVTPVSREHHAARDVRSTEEIDDGVDPNGEEAPHMNNRALRRAGQLGLVATISAASGTRPEAGDGMMAEVASPADGDSIRVSIA